MGVWPDGSEWLDIEVIRGNLMKLVVSTLCMCVSGVYFTHVAISGELFEDSVWQL